MTRQDLLLIKSMEEAAEVSQRLAKALWFGMEQIQQATNDKPEQNPNCLTNSERVIEEYNDFVATMEMAGFPLTVINGRLLDAKRIKVEKYLRYAQTCGTLGDADAPVQSVAIATPIGSVWWRDLKRVWALLCGREPV